jgi:hypothetical protein
VGVGGGGPPGRPGGGGRRAPGLRQRFFGFSRGEVTRLVSKLRASCWEPTSCTLPKHADPERDFFGGLLLLKTQHPRGGVFVCFPYWAAAAAAAAAPAPAPAAASSC